MPQTAFSLLYCRGLQDGAMHTSLYMHVQAAGHTGRRTGNQHLPLRCLDEVRRKGRAHSFLDASLVADAAGKLQCAHAEPWRLTCYSL